MSFFIRFIFIMMVLLLVTLHRGSLLDSFIYLLFHYDEANRNRIMRIDNMDTKLIALKEFVNLKEKGTQQMHQRNLCYYEQ